MKRKYLTSLFIAAIIILAAIGVNASDYRSEVKVGLKYGDSAGNNVKVSSSGGLNIYNAVTGDIIYQAAADEEVSISMWVNGFSSGEKFEAEGVFKLSAQVPGGGIIKCDGAEYRGYIYIEKCADGTLLVINYVGTDDYVSSVLGKEMSYTWPKEALKAQSVCARNFVLTRGSAHKNYGFDVCPTTHCQVYGGVKSEHENTRQAVEETKGVLGYYNNNLVGLYFFATSGGHTENVENVWGGSYGYLKAVPDTYENPAKASKYNWTEKFTRAQIEEKLEKNGISVGTLNNITIDSQSETGRVLKMTFHGTEGSKSVKLEKCRTVLGLYSQKFTITPDKLVSLETTSGAATAPLYACSAYGVGGIAGFSSISDNGIISEINMSSDGSVANYVINGNGYGHGVGMSQWGARGMAENGFTYDQILRHYFTGLELR